jgi:hypothetical protein
VKSYILFVFIGLIVLASAPARPQTLGTHLVMSAHWDDGTRVEGSVTLAQTNPAGPDTTIVTQNLTRGRASVSEPLSANSLYYVTLVTSAGTQLIKFPVTTALINPANLKQAEIDVVCRKADNSLKSAQFSVSMAF